MPSSHVGGSLRILVVEDHAVVRAGLKMLIESRTGMTVVGEARTASEAIELAGRSRPDVVLLDLDLGDHSGLDFIGQIQAAAAGARILILTGSRSTDTYQEAVRRGARGVVVKDQAADTLLRAVEKVHAGELWLDRASTAKLLERMSSGAHDVDARKIQSLTTREREIVAFIARGFKNQDIADRLGISEITVRHHLTSIFSKLEVTDRLALALYAFQHRLAEPPRA
ncbi:MAG TPA: response regulator transcription factor [Vicinamibacterales bacterium]|nr:response regulator transcription factor [Vicinamibacterales bacterium]